MRLILSTALTLMVGNMFQQMYTIVDASVVGRGIGLKALAALGSADWFNWLFFSIVIGFAQGFSIPVAQAFGAKDYDELRRNVGNATSLGLLTAAAITAIALLVATPVLNTMGTPDEVRPMAAAYLRVLFSGIPIVMGYNLLSGILRALGDSRSPLLAMVLSSLINILLDCLFVFVFHLGIIGAAMASLLAQLVSFLYCLYAVSRIEFVTITKQDWQFDFHKIKSMLLFGIPICFQYVVVTMGGMILQSSINTQGSIFIAGYTATNKLYGFLQCFATSIGQATCTFVSQNYGAGLGQRVRQGVVDSVKIIMIMAFAIIAATLLVKSQLLGVFLDVSKPEGIQAVEISVRYLTIMVLAFPILHILYIFRNVLQAFGIAIWSLMSGFAELAARILMSKFLINLIGVDALFLSEPASWFGAMLCVFLPYFYYRKKLLR